MNRLITIVVALLFAPCAAADEADDRLARELMLVVRDPLTATPARVQAARTLARLGPKARAAVTDLSRLVGRLRVEEMQPLQEAIIDALGQIGHPARPAIPALTREAGYSTDIDRAVARAIEQILRADDGADLPTLVRQLSHPDESLRLRAAKALGKLGPAAKTAVPNLTAALGDDDSDVRRTALAALKLVQPDVSLGEVEVTALARDLQDADPTNRLRAVKALGAIGSAAAPALQTALEDRDPDVRRAATDMLNRLAPQQ